MLCLCCASFNFISLYFPLLIVRRHYPALTPSLQSPISVLPHFSSSFIFHPMNQPPPSILGHSDLSASLLLGVEGMTWCRTYTHLNTKIKKATFLPWKNLRRKTVCYSSFLVWHLKPLFYAWWAVTACIQLVFLYTFIHSKHIVPINNLELLMKMLLLTENIDRPQ